MRRVFLLGVALLAGLSACQGVEPEPPAPLPARPGGPLTAESLRREFAYDLERFGNPALPAEDAPLAPGLLPSARVAASLGDFSGGPRVGENIGEQNSEFPTDARGLGYASQFRPGWHGLQTMPRMRHRFTEKAPSGGRDPRQIEIEVTVAQRSVLEVWAEFLDRENTYALYPITGQGPPLGDLSSWDGDSDYRGRGVSHLRFLRANVLVELNFRGFEEAPDGENPVRLALQLARELDVAIQRSATHTMVEQFAPEIELFFVTAVEDEEGYTKAAFRVEAKGASGERLEVYIDIVGAGGDEPSVAHHGREAAWWPRWGQWRAMLTEPPDRYRCRVVNMSGLVATAFASPPPR